MKTATETVLVLVEKSHEKLNAAYSALVASGEVDLAENVVAQRLRRISEDLGDLYDLIEEIGLTTAEEDERAEAAPEEPDVDNDEFKCDRCGSILDNDDSIKVRDEYLCPTCADKTAVDVPIPYGLWREGLVLDSSSRDGGARTLSESLHILADEGVAQPDDVLTAAVLLFRVGAGTLAECLDTAIVWECG